MLVCDSFPGVGCWDLLISAFVGLSQSRASLWVPLLLSLVQKCKFYTVAPLCLNSSLCPYSSADQDWPGSVRLLIFFVFKLFFHHKAAGTALLGIDFWQHHKGCVWSRGQLGPCPEKLHICIPLMPEKKAQGRGLMWEGKGSTHWEADKNMPLSLSVGLSWPLTAEVCSKKKKAPASILSSSCVCLAPK